MANGSQLIAHSYPQLVHAVPGRVRIHLPGWSGQGQRRLETRLRQLQGVLSTQASSVTANLLIRFDPAAIDAEAILRAVQSLLWDGLPISSCVTRRRGRVPSGCRSPALPAPGRQATMRAVGQPPRMGLAARQALS
jgi:hypothetical protein